MKRILLFITLINFTIINAQINFNENVISSTYTSSITMKSIASKDINGDNKLDIVTASDYDNKIAWFENLNGDDAFSQEKIISTDATRVDYIELFDIDNDGDIDILSASGYDNKIAWFENIDGLGSFSNEHIISTNKGDNVLASDINNDGDIDILAVDNYNNLLVWFENIDGFGNFSSEQTIITNTFYVFDISVNDLDNDGDNDIILASSNKLIWFENLNGVVNFSTEKIIFENNAYNYYQNKVHSADIDNDGDIDIITQSSYELSWVMNDGFGNFSSKQIILSNSGFGYSRLSDLVKDIDGDNDLDILVGQLNNGDIWLKNTDGLGNFIEEDLNGIEPAVSNLSLLIDINNDGSIDLVRYGSINNERILSIVKNTNGLGDFENPKIINCHSTFYQCVNTVDFDYDGDIDIVTSSSPAISIYKKDEYGIYRQNFIEKVFYNDSVSSDFINTVDIDNDGDLDIVSMEYDYSLGWFENINNVFYYHQIESDLYGSKKSFVADIDADGWMDIIIVSSYDISWYKNYYTSFTGNSIGSNYGGLYETIDIKDLDNDGDLDIVSASSEDNKIAWYNNIDGLGNFSSENIISTDALGALDIKAHDIDNDGKTDIIITSSNNNEISWYKNLDNQGGFVKNIITDNANGNTFIQIGDIDNDNDLDVISSSEDNRIISWYENIDGVGSFGTQQIISDTILNARYLYITDMDADGKLDIISSSSENDNNDNKLALFKNLGQDTNIIGDVSGVLGISIYPNPTNNFINIKANKEIVKIEIYSKLGQKIKEITENKVDISNLTQGLYFIKVGFINGNFEVKKIVKK